MSDGAVFIWGAGDGGLGVVSGFAATVDPPLNPGFDAHGVAVATAELATCPIPALLRIPSDHSVIAAAAGSCHTVLHVVPVRPDPPDLDSLDHSGWFDPVKDQLMRAEAPFAEAALPCQEEIDEVFSCCRFNRPKTLASILEGDFRVDVRYVLFMYACVKHVCCVSCHLRV